MFCPEDLDQAMAKLKASTSQKDSGQVGNERDSLSERQEGQEKEVEEEEEEEEEAEEPVE